MEHQSTLFARTKLLYPEIIKHCAFQIKIPIKYIRITRRNSFASKINFDLETVKHRAYVV